jgi:hypothetical protein
LKWFLWTRTRSRLTNAACAESCMPTRTRGLPATATPSRSARGRAAGAARSMRAGMKRANAALLFDSRLTSCFAAIAAAITGMLAVESSTATSHYQKCVVFLLSTRGTSSSIPLALRKSVQFSCFISYIPPFQLSVSRRRARFRLFARASPGFPEHRGPSPASSQAAFPALCGASESR